MADAIEGAHRFLDARRRFTDQNQPLHPPTHRFLQLGEIAPLVTSPRDQEDRLLQAFQRSEGGVHIRALGVIHKPHPPPLAHRLQRVFDAGKRLQDPAYDFGAAPADPADCDRGQCVREIVRPGNSNVGPPTHFLLASPDDCHDTVSIQIGSLRDPARPAESQGPGAQALAQAGNPFVVQVQQREVLARLVLENPGLGQGIAVHRRVAIQMIRRDVQYRRDPRMESLDRLELKAGDLHNEIVIDRRGGVPGPAPRPVGRERRFAQRRTEVAAREDPPAALFQDEPHQRHRGALAVRAGDGDDRRAQETGRQLQFADDPHAPPPGRLQRLHAGRNAGADHHQVGPLERRLVAGSYLHRQGSPFQTRQRLRQRRFLFAIRDRDARSDGLEQPRRRHSAPGQPNHGDLLPFQIRLHHRLPHWCESRPSAVRYQLPRPS